MFIRNPQKAFTLIELLVVISIIALLSTIVLGSMNDAREKAIIANIKEQVHQVQNALELYRNDHGTYPPAQMYYSDLMNNYLSDYIEYTPISFSGIKSFSINSTLQEPKIPYYITPGIPGLPTLSCEDEENLPYALIFSSQAGGVYPETEYLRNHYGPRKYFKHYGLTSDETTWAHWGFCLSSGL